jgi:hypothetical protein
MTAATALMRPFNWLRELFIPQVSERVETIVELLECEPEKFALQLEKKDGVARVYLYSTEPLYTFPDDTPVSDIRILLDVNEMRLKWINGGDAPINRADRLALAEAVANWLDSGERQE